MSRRMAPVAIPGTALSHLLADRFRTTLAPGHPASNDPNSRDWEAARLGRYDETGEHSQRLDAR